jgi:hypothetical protein
MNKLIILSDLWGKEKAEWVTHYADKLNKHFDVQFYDSCDLGHVNKKDFSEEKLHANFINGGIEKAVNNLIEVERNHLVVLGFSVGGLIGWKAGLLGLKMERLIAVSSTRLRYEHTKPLGLIDLHYSNEDLFKPNKEWFDKLSISEQLYMNEEHDFYKKKEIAEIICEKILKTT